VIFDDVTVKSARPPEFFMLGISAAIFVINLKCSNVREATFDALPAKNIKDFFP
jgi:hypothetical protein